MLRRQPHTCFPPVRVVKLTDAEAIEAQCVENLQREDIHPLEEALGFKSLLELGEPAYTIAIIASRAGKSEAYVYGRIRLADLIPAVAEAFLKDQITIGHALLIAKLPASQQQEAFLAVALACPQAPERSRECLLLLRSRELGDQQSVADGELVFQKCLSHGRYEVS